MGKKVTLEEIKELRENKKAFEIFSSQLLPAVRGMRWHSRKMDKKVSDTFTLSDEAWCLLVCVNNHERWSDECATGVNKSKLKAKYTDSKKGNKAFWGWSTEGIQEFNELYKLIKQDRAKNKQVEEDLIAERKAKEQAKQKEATNVAAAGGVIIAKCELFGDSDDEDEDGSNEEEGGSGRDRGDDDSSGSSCGSSAAASEEEE